MKKTLLFIMALTVFSFSSCTVKLIEDYRLGGESEDITYVDVYNVESIDGSVLDIRGKASPVYTIRGAAVNGFINELLSVDYGNKVYFPVPIDYGHVFAPGYVVFINYADGAFDVYAEKGVYTHRYNPDGTLTHHYSPHSYLGDIPWTEFVEKYIQK